MRLNDYLPPNFVDSVDKDAYNLSIKTYKYYTDIKVVFHRKDERLIELALYEIGDYFDNDIEDIEMKPRSFTVKVKNNALPKFNPYK